MKYIEIQTPRGIRRVGRSESPLIVAELSANHEGSLEKALHIVKAAGAAGADAIKLQTYTADTMTIDSDKPCFFVRGEEAPEEWKKKTLYQLYKEAHTPWEWHPVLQKAAEEVGLVWFSTPFDETSVEFLTELNVPCFKISSYEATDHVLLKRVAKTGKPVIMSVGFATLEEIEESVAVLRHHGAKELVLLFCTTSYSAQEKVKDTNLATMLDLERHFDLPVGFSDNMGGIEVPTFAVSLGASVIEKHIVLTHSATALDDRFSLDAQEFGRMVRKIRTQDFDWSEEWKKTVTGTIRYGAQTEAERQNLKLRRSLFVVRDMQQGDVFSPENLRSIRPSDGLPTKHYTDVIGKRALHNIERGTPLSWNNIENTD